MFSFWIGSRTGFLCVSTNFQQLGPFLAPSFVKFHEISTNCLHFFCFGFGTPNGASNDSHQAPLLDVEGGIGGQ